MEKQKQPKTLEWIRDIRNKNYEDWCNDPIGHEERRKERMKKIIKEYGVDKWNKKTA